MVLIRKQDTGQVLQFISITQNFSEILQRIMWSRVILNKNIKDV